MFNIGFLCQFLDTLHKSIFMTLKAIARDCFIYTLEQDLLGWNICSSSGSTVKECLPKHLSSNFVDLHFSFPLTHLFSFFISLFFLEVSWWWPSSLWLVSSWCSWSATTLASFYLEKMLLPHNWFHLSSSPCASNKHCSISGPSQVNHFLHSISNILLQIHTLF